MVTQKLTQRIKQKFEKKIGKIKNNRDKFKKPKFSNFRIVKNFKKIAIYQKFSITAVKINSMLVDATNVKNQKNLFVFDTKFKLNKLTKVNPVMKLKLKRSTMNINKSSSKVILSRKKSDRFREIKLNDKTKNT